MRILVTGAAGFIGSHVASALLDGGFEVSGLDNFDPFYARALKEESLAILSSRPGFEFHEGDIRDEVRASEAIAGCEAVIHLAARAGVRPSIEEPVLYGSVNYLGTAELLELSRKIGVRAFLFGSSSSVYGDEAPVPFREDFPAVNPISPYAATKRAGELLCETYAHLFGMRITSLRFFTVYGPRQRPDLAIHKFTRLLSENRPIPRFGDGSSERDYTHVDDIVQGVLGALRWTLTAPPGHEIFNLGESKTVRLDRLIELVALALGRKAVVDPRPCQPGDVTRTYADISKAGRMLGYRPRASIEEGIPEFVEWYRMAHGNQ